MTDDRDVVLHGNHDDTGTTKQRRGAALYDVLPSSFPSHG